ncbi:MAG: hypothetical protein K9J25_04045 [Bacteroidales bacterium]|nr:hypothetical protein [Bacteroidales bacterium]
MKDLDIIRISFRNKIKPGQLSAFRSAIAQTAGFEKVLFHNHLGDNYRQEYPLIQYKFIAGYPNIIALGKGIEEMQYFFLKKERNITLDGKTYPLKVMKTALNRVNVRIEKDTAWEYTLHHWLPFNQDNYRKHQSLKSLADKIENLQKILTGNILTFLEAVKVDKDIRLTVYITEITNRQVVKVNNVLMESYNINFEANTFLPNYVGIGKSASQGHGILRMKNK